MVAIGDYYKNPEIIKRMLEYCGASEEESSHFNFEYWDMPPSWSENLRSAADRMTVEFISGWGRHLKNTIGKKQRSYPKWDLGYLLENELDLFRSLWDEKNMTFLLDVEYLNDNDKNLVYRDPNLVFWKMEGLYRTTFDVLNKYKITPLVLATGQGYHFIFQIPSFNKDGSVTDVAQKMTDLGHVEATLQGKYEHYNEQFKARRSVSINLGKAFDTAGRLLEFLYHEVLKESGKNNNELPITVGDIKVGNKEGENINFDLSTYMSPIYTRVNRIAFSIHSKFRDKMNYTVNDVALSIPRYTPCNNYELPMHDLMRLRWKMDDAINYASAIHTAIPNNVEGINKLMNAYKKSKLFEHHKNFNATQRDNHTKWNSTYDQFDLRQLPPCLRIAFEQPNPHLLQPTYLHALTRAMSSKSWWHPAHIAGTISKEYERGHGWDYNWKKHDANTHARNWIRIYSGAIACGLDNKWDLNCLSQQEKGLCNNPGCGYNLESYR